jgi:DNA modification methylase
VNRLSETTQWPAATPTLRPLSELKPSLRNVRLHSEQQIDQLRASLREFGWCTAVLVDEEGRIIAGHGRVEAAKRESQTHVPVIVATGWTQTQCRAYAIADNRIPLNASWDAAALGVELQELSGLGVDLGTLGLDDQEIGEVLHSGTEGLTDPDEVPEPPAQPISRRGDVWLMGEHRLLCGDSTVAADVVKVLGGVKPHLMVTDPPYGVEYDPNWRNEAARTSKGMGNRTIGAGAVGKVLNDDVADWTETWKLFPGDVAYVWHGALHAPVVAASLAAAGFHVRSQIIWDKTRMIIGRGDYHWAHEPCWYVVRKGKTGHWSGDRKQTTIWRIAHQKSETGHGTQKPVECMRLPIENNSSPGQAVYEPFSGSGTTIIAAEQTGRACFAIELNPAYVDVAVKRWQDFKGEAAKLEGDGRDFATVATERLAAAA